MSSDFLSRRTGGLQFAGTLLIVGFVLSIGCGREPPQGPPREKTSPVSGTVYIDGQLAEDVSVQCIPQNGTPVQFPVTAKTDSQGNFKMGTYVAGDGLPAGTYRMTFEKLVGGGLEGVKDQLKGKYSKPEKSEFELVIEMGKPVVLDRVELTTK